MKCNDEALKNYIAEALKYTMKLKKLTIDQVCIGTGIGKTTMFMLLKGKQMPKVNTLLKLCLFLQMPMDVLIGSSITKKHQKTFNLGLFLFSGLLGFIICLLIKG